ncbi:MAG: glycosyltransferase family 9 protein [Acidobacteriota bacterium]|nr:glycosyltransferase family 9 protein [Acidobacteriota bacterium]
MRRLIIRPGAIGDFIVSLPAMQQLRADYTEVWAASQNVPLVRFADRARSIASVGLDRLGVLPADDVIAKLGEFDSIVSWYGASRPEFRELVSSHKLPFEFLSALPAAGSGMHAVDFYLKQVGAEGGAEHGAALPRIECSSTARDFGVIHPFASSARKRWPLARFQELASRLKHRMPVQWCCGPEERLAGAVQIANLYELGCWIASARVYVGNDSGITHLAAAVGARSVALFGPTDKAVWAPRGPHVHVIAKSNMEDISVTEVEDAIG